MNTTPQRLSNKACIVTGGARGLGRAIAELFIEHGAQVLITDINADAVGKTANEIGASFAVHDVCDEEQWSKIIDQCQNEFGGIDVLVSNAGLAGIGDGVSPEDTSLRSWQQTFAVNVEGVFLGCRAVIPPMRKAGGGSIINMSSVAAMTPTPFLTAYGASKAAVAHLSTSIALHGAPDKIRCNSVHPGQVQTDMHNGLVADAAATAGAPVEAVQEDFAARIPLGEFGLSEDIANMVSFLASDESRYVTGAQMVVDGGMQLIN